MTNLKGLVTWGSSGSASGIAPILAESKDSDPKRREEADDLAGKVTWWTERTLGGRGEREERKFWWLKQPGMAARAV